MNVLLGRTSRRRRMSLAMAAGVAIAASVATVLTWRHEDPDRHPRVPALDYSERPTLCLAVDDDTGPRSTAEKASGIIRSATGDRSANLQQLAVPAGAPQDAVSYLSGLAAQRCNLIVTVGPAAATGVPALSKADPALRFVVLDSPTSLLGPGVVVADQQDMTRALTAAVTAVAGPTPPP
jgi:basic membrane lipoprotein Med (substrate-binding protein (PBP1-ABC) superfamily)